MKIANPLEIVVLPRQDLGTCFLQREMFYPAKLFGSEE
jgi:hypothetical protein